jgi:hypothetical protein
MSTQLQQVSYRAGPNIPRFPTLNNIIQSFHDFLPRSLAVQSMDLQHVHVRAEAGNARVHGIENVFP